MAQATILLDNQTYTLTAQTAETADAAAAEEPAGSAEPTATAAAEDDAEITWICNGETVDVTGIRDKLAALTAEAFTSEAPADQLEISLALDLNDEDVPQVRIQLYRYDGELSGDQLGRAVELSGMDEMLSSYGAGADTVFQGSMPMSIWLDAETFAPVRYEFDMSQIVGGFMQGVFESEGAGLENSSVSVSLDLSEFDAIDSIEAPAGIE